MLGICYVIRKEGVIKSDQVRFKKGKKQKQPLSQTRVLICPEGSLRDIVWSETYSCLNYSPVRL